MSYEVMKKSDGLGSILPEQIEYFFGPLFDEFLDTAAKVYDRVTWNACDTNWLGIPLDCIPYAVVRRVLECYVSLQSEGKIPEYDPWGPDARAIEEAVAFCAGTVQNTARWVLYELYYGTADGTLRFGGATLRAKRWKEAEKDRGLPGGDWSFFGGVGETAETVLWVLGIGAIAVGAYLLWPILSPPASRQTP